jgi:nucleoid-associated protein YgaU
MANDQRIIVRPAERIDQIAERTYGDAFAGYLKIIEANPDMNIFYPLPNQILTIKHD